MFDDDRYFDVFVEYAKADADDILIRITVTNRGPERAPLDVLPTRLVPQHLVVGRDATRAALPRVPATRRSHRARRSASYGRRWLVLRGAPELLFTENETNASGCSAPERVALREGRVSTTTWSTASASAVNPDERGHQGGRPLPR